MPAFISIDTEESVNVFELSHSDIQSYYDAQAEAYAAAAEAAKTIAESARDAANDSELAAATSETNAAASEQAAAKSETNAATSESNAATSEANAAQSAADAQQSADDAANTLSELEWKQFVRNEAELNQMREQNKSVRAASGFDHYGKHTHNAPNIFNVNEGMYSYTAEPDTLHLGRDTTGTKLGTSSTDYPVACIAGIVSELLGTNQGAVSTRSSTQIKFPEAPDGTVTYNSVTGEVIQHADAATAFALADTSDDIEVVINRVDMFGAEFFLEEVSQTNPYVYPKGMVQSQATSMNGITTTTSNRPVTYYAVYDGDTGTQGKGVDFWAATDEQKKAMVSDETNNIFMLDDGRLVQWRMRQRTIAGAGNGDWLNVNSVYENSSKGFYLQFSSGSNFLAPQGALNVVNAFNKSNPTYRGSGGSVTATQNPNQKLGVFSLFDNTLSENFAINDECYFHVWGVVPRLNQGHYHPSLNPMGTDLKDTGQYWYRGNVINSTSECFTRRRGGGTGGVNSGRTGRPDGKFYDAIYASGQGGVIDYRLPSWDMSSKEEASKVFQKVVNGTYRGEEQVKVVELIMADAATSNTGSSTQVRVEYSNIGLVPSDKYSGPVKCDGYIIINGTDIQQINSVNFSANNNACFFSLVEGSGYNTTGHTVSACIAFPSNYSVSGEFTTVDVLGNPTEILATPALSNGWLGGWIPIIPGGDNQSGINWKYTRKALDTRIDYRTTDNGTTWTLGRFGSRFDYTINGRDTWSGGAGTIFYLPYIAFAKQTKESTNKKVLNSTEGLGQVHATYHHHVTAGATLVETLLGKVATSASTNARHTYTLQDYLIHEKVCTLDVGAGYLPTHATLDLAKPDDTTPAVKALWYQTANNQQASLNFAWNELVWDSTSAGLISGTTTQSYTENTRYRVQVDNNIYLVVSNVTGSYRFADYTRGLDAWVDSADRTYWTLVNGHSGSWGDDSTIRITDGTSTYTNLNGDTCLYGTAELAIPYGYTKNQARAGEQTEGVDL
ncbi:hypothetical protein [Vibrio diabolicus]|uniref:hypothetical protein n=1 Tax=Vibrio diabolicus TaxID=50719 RepID=UPI0037537331